MMEAGLGELIQLIIQNIYKRSLEYMSKKVISYSLIALILLIDICLFFYSSKYFYIINELFHKKIELGVPQKYIIYFTIFLISTLIYFNILLLMYKNKEIQKGINLKENDGTYGTANWMSNEEASGILGLNNEEGILLGKKDNKKVVLPFKSFFNKNILVIGSSRKYENNWICNT